jgi:hypothetical protein
MKKLLLCALTFFLLLGNTTNAQSTFSDEQSIGLPNFQNDQIISKNKIEIFPNPAVENIFVKIDNSELENVEIELFNIIGNSLSFEMEEIEKNNFKIKVADFPPGYYLLIIKDPVKRFNQAFKFHKVK